MVSKWSDTVREIINLLEKIIDHDQAYLGVASMADWSTAFCTDFKLCPLEHGQIIDFMKPLMIIVMINCILGLPQWLTGPPHFALTLSCAPQSMVKS